MIPFVSRFLKVVVVFWCRLFPKLNKQSSLANPQGHERDQQKNPEAMRNTSLFNFFEISSAKSPELNQQQQQQQQQTTTTTTTTDSKLCFVLYFLSGFEQRKVIKHILMIGDLRSPVGNLKVCPADSGNKHVQQRWILDVWRNWMLAADATHSKLMLWWCKPQMSV